MMLLNSVICPPSATACSLSTYVQRVCWLNGRPLESYQLSIPPPAVGRPEVDVAAAVISCVAVMVLLILVFSLVNMDPKDAMAGSLQFATSPNPKSRQIKAFWKRKGQKRDSEDSDGSAVEIPEQLEGISTNGFLSSLGPGTQAW